MASKKPAQDKKLKAVKTKPKSKAGSKKKPSSSRSRDNVSRIKPQLRLLEKRKHPRFLLSGEQFREIRTGKIFPVYDLSFNGLSLRVDEQHWTPGSLVKGILNLHPDSIEITVRLIGYYGDRAAFQLEMPSTYARGVLGRALQPKRLGASLRLIREKLPFADFWFHGVCNTDLLIKLTEAGRLFKAEVFFSNFYWSWQSNPPTGESTTAEAPAAASNDAHRGAVATGICQSIGRERREDMLLAEEPVMVESIQLAKDAKLDGEKVTWAKSIIESSPLDPVLKEFLLKQF